MLGKKNQHLNLANKRPMRSSIILQISIYLKAMHTDISKNSSDRVYTPSLLSANKEQRWRNHEGFVDSFQKEMLREDNGNKT